MKNNNFKLFLPLEIIKGKSDSNASPQMRMRGIASTGSKDEDGEYLDPSGFELDYFLKHGFMNWNHQTNNDPLSIIGKPTAASVKDDKMVVDFTLFDNHPKAQQVYELQQILQQQGLGLGLSIEGSVVERDPNNLSKVRKAKITGCAVTPNPKNRDTVAQIIKSHNFNIISAYDNEDEETREKAMMASNYASGKHPLSLESLDKQVHSLISSDKLIKVSKGLIYEKIYRHLPQLLHHELEDLCLIIQKNNNMQKGQEINISEQIINEAYDLLKKGQETTVIEEVPVVVETPSTDEVESVIEKSLTNEVPSQQFNLDEIKELSLMVTRGLEKINDFIEKSVVKNDVEKSEVSTPIITQTNEVVVGKSEVITNDLTKGVVDLLKGHFQSMEEKYDSKFSAVATLCKGLENQLQEVNEKITKFENQPAPIKSIRTRNFIEKSFSNEVGNVIEKEKGKVFSLSRDKTSLCQELTKSILNDNGEVVDAKVANDIMLFEMAGNITPLLSEKIRALGFDVVR